MSTINIAGLDLAEVLAALWNNSQQQGMGFLNHLGAKSRVMSTEEARDIIDGVKEGRNLYFDYLHGRVMKIHLGRDAMEVSLYDRDNGQGAAARALQPLLDKRDSN